MKALDQVTPTLRELAEEAGINYGTLRMYAAGERVPDDPKVIRAIIAALRRHAGKVSKAADELERVLLREKVGDS